MISSPGRSRAVVVGPLLGTALASLLLAGCGSGGQAAPTESSAPPLSTATTAPASSPAPSSDPAVTTSGASGDGCAATSETVPDGAATAPTADLDHDGRADELWLADEGDQRVLGVRTASGAVVSTAYTTGSPIPTTAIGQALDGSTSVVLLSDGRQVPLYAFTTGSGGCQLVATQNEQGQQYTFDLGFTGYGSGVACVPASQGSSDLDLYGLLVVGGEVEGDLPGIQRTRIELSDGGRQARNGPTDSPAELQGINPEGAQVAAARQVRCGDQGPDTAVSEPS